MTNQIVWSIEVRRQFQKKKIVWELSAEIIAGDDYKGETYFSRLEEWNYEPTESQVRAAIVAWKSRLLSAKLLTDFSNSI